MAEFALRVRSRTGKVSALVVAVLSTIVPLLTEGHRSATAAEAGAWAPAGELSIARSDHQATLLDGPECSTEPKPAWCGHLLVTGGASGELESNPLVLGASRSAELFDPNADGGKGAWASCSEDTATPTCPAPMSTFRRGHASVLLEDGRVLVVGGHRSSGATGTEIRGLEEPAPEGAEIYDPSTGRWSPAANLPEEILIQPEDVPPARPGETIRSGSATLLTGVACDGPDRPSWCGNVLVASTGTAAATFDPDGVGSATGVLLGKEGSWTLTEPMAAKHGQREAPALPDGRVLVVGGSNAPEIFDPATSTWSTTEPITTRQHPTVTVPGGPQCVKVDPPPWCGRALVAGGVLNGFAPAEIFDPTTDTWSTTAPFSDSTPRYHGHRAVSLEDGTVLVAGGRTALDASGEYVETAQLYDADLATWIPAGFLSPRVEHSLARLKTGAVLAAGGDGPGEGHERSSMLYRPPRAGPPAGLVPRIDSVSPDRGPLSGGTEVRIHGANFSGISAVHFGDQPATRFRLDESTPDNLVIAETSSSSSPGPVQVMVTTSSGGSSVDADPAHPATFTYMLARGGAWEDGAFLHQDRALHVSTPLEDGRVLVSGGYAPVSRDIPNVFDRATDLSIALSELYDPSSGRWSDSGSMVSSRFLHTATALPDGRVLAAGGANDPPGQLNPAVPVSSTEVWDPAGTDPLTGSEGAWAQGPPMSVARVGHTATRLDGAACEAAVEPISCGDILVVGGDTVGTAELYDHESGGWRSVAGPPGGVRTRHTATLMADGRVLVVGGEVPSPGADSYPATGSAAIYDPSSGAWTQAGKMFLPRTRHTATLLLDGSVLLAGGNKEGPTAHLSSLNDLSPAYGSAEIFDPQGCGGDEAASEPDWCWVGSMVTAREGHTATQLPNGSVLIVGGSDRMSISVNSELFDRANGFVVAEPIPSGRSVFHSASLLPPEFTGDCARRCGKVLVSGGFNTGNSIAIAASNLFFPTPAVTAVTPATGPNRGGTEVTITGTGLAGVSGPADVVFDVASADPRAIQAREVTVVSDRELQVVTPSHSPGGADVRVQNPGGISDVVPGARFAYTVLDRVEDLVAEAVDQHTVRLRFTPPGDPVATRFVVKQALFPLEELEAFEAAPPLCGGVCEFEAADTMVLTVGDLLPNTTYHYALAELKDDGTLGPLSNAVSVTTVVCAAPSAGPGQVVLPAGYSLVGMPAGTVVGSDSPLYGWFDRREGQYSQRDPQEAAEAGRGYWAFSFCPRLVDLAGSGSGVSLSLSGGHASMVGNPTDGPVTVEGHDYAARWDPAANDGEGGYVVSGYREPMTLGVGEGAWVFSYVPTTIQIGP